MEVGVGNATGLDEIAFAKVIAQNDAVAVTIKAACSLLPDSLPVVDPNVDLCKVEACLDLAFSRLSRCGVSLVVFGSGGVCKAPEGFERADAWTKLIEAGYFLARKAENTDYHHA